jgi:predicted transposase YdaD
MLGEQGDLATARRTLQSEPGRFASGPLRGRPFGRSDLDLRFKVAFAQPEHAAELLSRLLPPSLVSEVDWATLSLESATFVDPSLASRHGDLLFSASIGNSRLYVLAVVEHQSRSVHRMCLRALGYIVRKWERDARPGEPLPLIVAIVVSHAPEGWTSPVHMHELLRPTPASLQGVAELVPGFRILVYDVARTTDDQLKALSLSALPTVALWALRDGRDPGQLLGNIVHFVDELRELSRSAALGHVLRYVWLVCEDVHFEQFTKVIRDKLPELEEQAMTIAEELIQRGRAEAMTMAEELIQKGRAEGRVEGRVEGRAELLVKLLVHKFGELPTEYLAGLADATDEQLERYAMRVVTVETLAAVFADD